MEGTSPLYKDFDPATAPLVLTFQLVAQTETGQALSMADLETLNGAIVATNRPHGQNDHPGDDRCYSVSARHSG